MTLALELPSESIFNACSHYSGRGSCRGGLAAGRPQLAQGSPHGQSRTAVILGDSQQLRGDSQPLRGTQRFQGMCSDCGGLAAIAGDSQRLRGDSREVPGLEPLKPKGAAERERLWSG